MLIRTISGNHNITGASIKMVGRGCPDLVHLFIIDCIQMCDTGLKVLTVTHFVYKHYLTKLSLHLFCQYTPSK